MTYHETYHDKLKDPRWQKLRLEVFERDSFSCVSCTGKSKTLHLHHKIYHPNPWDAHPDELSTLCEECHENLEIAIKLLRERPEIQPLPHIVNRTVMLEDKDSMLPYKLLGKAIGLCGENDADDALGKMATA